MRLLRAFALILGLAAIFATPLTVSAAHKDTNATALTVYERVATASDPWAAYLALSPRDRDLFQLAVTPSTTEEAPLAGSGTDGVMMAASGGCWYAQKGIQGKSLAGVVLWQFNLRIDWCSDGSHITGSPTYRVWPSNMALGWNYDTTNGWPVVHRYGGVGSTYYEIWTQGHMQLCFPLAGCVQHQYPWVDVRGNANGTYSGSAGM